MNDSERPPPGRGRSARELDRSELARLKAAEVIARTGRLLGPGKAGFERRFRVFLPDRSVIRSVLMPTEDGPIALPTIMALGLHPHKARIAEIGRVEFRLEELLVQTGEVKEAESKAALQARVKELEELRARGAEIMEECEALAAKLGVEIKRGEKGIQEGPLVRTTGAVGSEGRKDSAALVKKLALIRQQLLREHDELANEIAEGRTVPRAAEATVEWVREWYPRLSAVRTLAWTRNPGGLRAELERLEELVALQRRRGLSTDEAERNVEVLKADLADADAAARLLEGAGYRLSDRSGEWTVPGEGKGRPTLLRSVIVDGLGSALAPLAPARVKGKQADHEPLTLAVSRTLDPYLNSKAVDPGARGPLRTQISGL